MKVMLIFPDVHSFHSVEYHPGLASISGYLKFCGHEVKLEYLTSKEQFKDVLEHIKSFSPDVVGFSSVETQFIYVKILSKLIKKMHKCLIVCGGVYVTLFPEVIESAENIDIIIRGEGEFAFVELLECLRNNRSYLNINHLCYYDKNTERVVINKLNPLIDNLDLLPFQDRSIFNFQDVIDKHRFVLFYFNRGCPYRCTYCCNHALARVYDMKVNKMRYRSVESCMAEIKEVLKNYRINVPLFFGDDIFGINQRWLDEFLDVYKREINLPFMCEYRCNFASSEMFKKLKAAGCIFVSMGIESGNDFIRNKIMKRGMSKKQIFNAFNWAHENGFTTTGTCIIGLPFETKEMIEETAEVCAKTCATNIGVNIFYPYKGTELRKLCEEYDFLPENIEDIEILDRKESILNLPHISKEILLFYRNNWEKVILSKRDFKSRIKYYYNNSRKFPYEILVRLHLYNSFSKSRSFIISKIYKR